MIVSCPSCGTSFFLEDSQVAPEGRNVRCGACGHRWRQHPGDEQEEAAPSDETDEPAADAGEESPASESAAEQALEQTQERTPDPAPATDPPPSAEPPPVRGPMPFPIGGDDILDDDRRFALFGWTVFALVLALLAAGFYFGQGHIVAFEPRFQRLYDLVGMGPVNADSNAALPGEGLSFPADRLVKTRTRIDGKAMILIEGIVLNETDDEKRVPVLRATVSGADGEVFARWIFTAESAQLAPRGETTFSTSIPDQWGRQGVGISLIFVSDEVARNEQDILPNTDGR